MASPEDKDLYQGWLADLNEATPNSVFAEDLQREGLSRSPPGEGRQQKHGARTGRYQLPQVRNNEC